MNCKAIRRLFTTDPRSENREALQHLEQCTPCRQWMVKLQAFEGELGSLLKQESPAGLQSRIMQRCRESSLTPLSIEPPSLNWWRSTLAIAASLLLFIGLIGPISIILESDEQLDQRMQQWLATQQPEQYLQQQATDSDVQSMFREMGAKLVADVGPILHCRVTQIGDYKVGFFVIKSGENPVSIILMGDGSKSLFIKGRSKENNIEQRIRRAILWI